MGEHQACRFMFGQVMEGSEGVRKVYSKRKTAEINKQNGNSYLNEVEASAYRGLFRHLRRRVGAHGPSITSCTRPGHEISRMRHLTRSIRT